MTGQIQFDQPSVPRLKKARKGRQIIAKLSETPARPTAGRAKPRSYSY
jgi:hypothetical protein